MATRWTLVGCLLVVCAPAFAETGKAMIQGTAEGSPIAGTAIFADTDQGLHITVQVAHVPPGLHGLHVHQFGSCQDAGKAAGGHYNPDEVKHGYLPKDGFMGAHAGDLGNIEIGPDGSGTLDLTLPDLSLNSELYNVGGRAVILHEKPDDFSQPTGNAGGRIGCGPILITGE